MDDDVLAAGAELGALLKSRAETVAVAESSSGGLISAALLAAPGASAYFLSGAIVYTAKARYSLLQLPREAVAGMRSASVVKISLGSSMEDSLGYWMRQVVV